MKANLLPEMCKIGVVIILNLIFELSACSLKRFNDAD